MRENRGMYLKGFGSGYGIKLLCCLGLIWISLTGCGSRLVFTSGLGKDEVFRISDEVCTLPELMVYLTNTQNQYESVYGAQVWNVSLNGVTLEENVKENVLAKLAQIKTMYLLARDREIELDESESRRAQSAEGEYFNSLNETEKELLGVEFDTIVQLYREYAMADKVYRYIIQDVNPEISDDEARTITVQHILLYTYTTDGAGKRIDYSEDVKAQVCEKAREIRRRAVEEGEDFLELAARYSEDSMITYSFGKGETDMAFESAAFMLETGEVSDVVETDTGYHIIKCISTFDREQTDLNKLQIVEERRREVFGQEYDAFVEQLIRQLNTELWGEITLLHNEEVDTADFFEVYQKYFPE